MILCVVSVISLFFPSSWFIKCLHILSEDNREGRRSEEWHCAEIAVVWPKSSWAEQRWSESHSMNSTHPSPHKQQFCAMHACALWLPYTMPWSHTHTHTLKYMDKALLLARLQTLAFMYSVWEMRLTGIWRQNKLYTNIDFFLTRFSIWIDHFEDDAVPYVTHKRLPNSNLTMLQFDVRNTHVASFSPGHKTI